MQEPIRLIQEAKALIDNGMCRVGPGLKASRKPDAWLTGAAGRSLALADAVAQLCRHAHANEALPAVRHLAETAVAMNWLVSGDAEKRALELAAEMERPRWEDLWPAERLLRRAKESGLPLGEAKEAVASAREFVLGGRRGLPWSHVFSSEEEPGERSEAVLVVTVRLLGYVVKALEAWWPGSFPGSEKFFA